MLAFASFSQQEDVALAEAFELSKMSNSREAYNKAKEQFYLDENSKMLAEEVVDRVLVVARYFRDIEFVTELYGVESKKSACGCGAQCNKHHHHKHD